MLWEGGLHMNLRQINELWNEYKEKYDLPKDVQISAVQYDAEKYVEGFFNILELLDGKYILHLNPRFHLYSDSYARFILFHEFTHFYDFITVFVPQAHHTFWHLQTIGMLSITVAVAASVRIDPHTAVFIFRIRKFSIDTGSAPDPLCLVHTGLHHPGIQLIQVCRIRTMLLFHIPCIRII